MKKLLIISLLAFIAIKGQTTFQNFYKLNPRLNCQDILLGENSYDVISFGDSLTVYNISYDGQLLTKKPLDIQVSNSVYKLNKNTYPVKFLGDGSIVSLERTEGDGSDSLFITIINQSSDRTLLDFLYTTFHVSQDVAINVLNQNEFNVFYTIGSGYYELRSYNRAESDWQLSSTGTYFLKGGSLGPLVFNCNDDSGNMYVANHRHITKLSSSLDTLWTDINWNRSIQKIIPYSENLLVVYEDSLTYYDSIGKKIWQLSPARNIRDVEITSADEIIIVGRGTIAIYSMEGQLIQEQHTSFDINFAKSITNGNIFYSADIFMAVVGSDGLLEKELYLNSQNSPQSFFTSEMIPINWANIGNEFVDLFYSVDGGDSWIEIINYFPANSWYYWEPPYKEIDKILIKVAAYDTEEVFGISSAFICLKIFDEYTALSGNNIYMWLGNNGLGSYDPYAEDTGFFWPGGNSESANAVYADGLVWGGIVDDEIKVNGNTYRNGLQPGKIVSDGIADYPYQTDYKIYKLKKNWELEQPGKERDKYKYDYENWPGYLGAPYTDMNNDGVYTSGTDEPEVIGEETVFYVANDLDTAACKSTYGSDPIGLEFTTTAYAYSYPLENVVFKNYVIVNKSGKTISDMYFAYWADVEVGYANDDYLGCDRELSLAYGYNADGYDDLYGALPPAVGHMLLQGPVVPGSENDSAKFIGKTIHGYKNLRMTSFTPNFKNYADLPNDPRLGDYEGTLQFYDIMHGLSEKGDSIINPYTGKGTVFPLSGDPEKGTGWYEGEGWPEGPDGSDRCYTMSAGPFDMAPGDTQHVVYAILVERGTNYVNSVTALKESAREVQEWYGNEIITGVVTSENIPNKFTLSQNYPNPFNPTTTIEYTLPSNVPPLSGGGGGGLKAPMDRGDLSKVRLVIFDILGREVATLVDKQQKPGTYKVLFNASNLASGVYFYNLHYGDKRKSKKMILIK